MCYAEAHKIGSRLEVRVFGGGFEVNCFESSFGETPEEFAARIEDDLYSYNVRNMEEVMAEVVGHPL